MYTLKKETEIWEEISINSISTWILLKFRISGKRASPGVRCGPDILVTSLGDTTPGYSVSPVKKVIKT